MKNVVQIEHSASSSRSKHEGESSFGLCDRLSRTRDNSQRQLPTDQDYAVSTREYQTDQSSLKTAPTAARSVLEKRRNQRQQQTRRLRRLTRSLHIRPKHSSTSAFRWQIQRPLDQSWETPIAPADWLREDSLSMRTLSPIHPARTPRASEDPQSSGS